MVDLAEIPTEKKIAILRAAAAHAGDKIPHLALPDIAHHHGMTLDQVKAVVYNHGWPKAPSMQRAATILSHGGKPADDTPEENTAAAAAEPAPPKPATAGELVDVDVEQLHPDPNNVREDLGDLRELVNSIRDVGILQPIVARRHAGRLVIVMGHRRHAAAKLAGLARVQVIVRPGDMDPDDVLAAMLVENGQRLDLDPIEEARALARLKRADKMSDLLLAERISKSQPYVSGRLALLSLTPQQQAAVRAGTLSLARAIRLGREQGGTTKPTATGKKSAAHLTWHHPLAEKAAILCQHNGHHKNTPGRVGNVACGQCWEAVIRSDERDRIQAVAS